MNGPKAAIPSHLELLVSYWVEEQPHIRAQISAGQFLEDWNLGPCA